MITTVAELLQELMLKERAVLDASPIEHRPTIGSMYEGLSIDILGRAIPDGLDLNLVTGFAVDDDGNMSGQLDCMLVRGAGIPVPYTTAFQWHIRDVIAVFEIKKTLYSAELKDAFQHLGEVRELEKRYRASLTGDAALVDLRRPNRAYAEVTGQDPPEFGAIESLPADREALFRTLLDEYHSALRIIVGFHGFKSEHSFRESLVSYLTENLRTPGFGPGGFPQLIVSGDYTLAKANGQPYSNRLTPDGWWPFYFSTAVNPLHMILEYVWTRLDQMFGIGGLWGEDLELEVPHALLVGKAEHTPDGAIGWNYRFVNNTPELLTKLGASEAWQPFYPTDEQAVILMRLQQGKDVRLTDEKLISFLSRPSDDLDQFWDDLLTSGLVAKSSDGTELRLIATQCDIAYLPDGRIVAGENNTGRLSRWIANNTAESGKVAD
ncbi:hypothetical protein EV138_6482 [Kribbella voronezhensis]|uniref:DUF6602 domain-containing protein n=1 Tax=Kribbella voronezhensis TaxID=2512212 RepID=A0A4R7SXK1_9ACTN|nr:DUF6602 domain-containing protein [Kribbella voronezhensis]TDU84014.1 hypothetical protein EV138_6482 [Kribbella voronezhensis]